jgi:O-antigen ligase
MIVLKKLKYFFMVLAICAIVIENLPNISLVLGIIYILFSTTDWALEQNKKLDAYFKHIIILWFLLFFYITVITILMPLDPDRYEGELLDPINFKWVRALLLLVLVYKDCVEKESMIKVIAKYYLIMCVAMALLAFMGVGISVDRDIENTRLTFFETNPNKFAMYYVYAFVLLIFVIRNTAFKHRLKKLFFYLAICVTALCYITIILFTASRGALACVAILVICTIFYKRKFNKLTGALILLVIGIVVYFVGETLMSSSEEIIVARRLEDTFENEDYGKRDVLISEAWNIFMESPIIGNGLNNVMYKIQMTYGKLVTPHNLFLYILSAGGIIGFSLFCGILYLICVRVYRFGYKIGDLLAVLLWLMVLIDFAKNGGSLTATNNYVFLAIALASTTLSYKRIHASNSKDL